MKAFPLTALVLLLYGYSSPRSDSVQDVRQFYLAQMSDFTRGPDTSRDTSALLQRYMAKDIIDHLVLIGSLCGQETLDSDYFMYVQDYDLEWTPLLRAGSAHPFLDGEKVEVQLGRPTDKAPIPLEVYTRWEKGRQEIYRVMDLSNHLEQPIYSTGDIVQARAWSAEIVPEHEKMDE